jgi:predicted ABC-type ATPase
LKPVLLVIAGPNGAGKTTVTSRLREERWSEGVEYLNPDEVARDRFGDWNSPEAILKAAEWTKQRREELLAQGAGIAFETVLSTDEKIDFLARAKDAGYFVRVFFIATSDPRINAARVADRVLAGGHAVPIAKILSRHVRAVGNLGATP